LTILDQILEFADTVKSSPTLLFLRRELKLLPLQREVGRDFSFDFLT